MVEIYYYLPASEADNAIQCGIKLSSHYDREVAIEGEMKKCLSALLNPRDDMEKYMSQNFRCLKLELAPHSCFVANRCLYQAAIDFPELMEEYVKSIVPLEKYIFGAYRLPECLVTSTVIAGQISLAGRGMDSPILYRTSEDLYLSNIMEEYRENHDDFYDAVLYCFYSRLAEEGKVKRVDGRGGRFVLFFDKRSGRVVTIRMPDMERY